MKCLHDSRLSGRATCMPFMDKCLLSFMFNRSDLNIAIEINLGDKNQINLLSRVEEHEIHH